MDNSPETLTIPIEKTNSEEEKTKFFFFSLFLVWVLGMGRAEGTAPHRRKSNCAAYIGRVKWVSNPVNPSSVYSEEQNVGRPILL